MRRRWQWTSITVAIHRDDFGYASSKVETGNSPSHSTVPLQEVLARAYQFGGYGRDRGEGFVTQDSHQG